MLSLRTKVLFVFTAFAFLLAGGLFLYTHMSFEYEFNRYIEQKETEKFAPLVNTLQTHFAQHQEWSPYSNTDVWEDFIEQNARIPFPMRQQASQNTGEGTLPEAEPFYTGFILYDATNKPLVGKKRSHEDYLVIPLKNNTDQKSTIIGYLHVPINPALRDLRDAEFLQHQQRHFLRMSIIALVIAFLCAIPLSYILTQRAKNLALQVTQLSNGNYDIPANPITHRYGYDELTLLSNHLNHLAQTLSNAESARKLWVANISHELRTPLAVLQAELEAIEDGIHQFDENILHRLQKHTQRLTHLINDLYELSLTDMGGMTYRKEICSINDIINELSKSISNLCSNANLQFEVLTQDKTINLFADPQRLQQLLLNILSNSIAYTDAPGTILLQYYPQQDHLHIVIEDSAPGVDPSLHETLFDRFYRQESSRNRATGGAGLGLSICRNIVTAHQGDISISNSTLGGLRVLIQLPLLQS